MLVIVSITIELAREVGFVIGTSCTRDNRLSSCPLWPAFNIRKQDCREAVDSAHTTVPVKSVGGFGVPSSCTM